MQVLHASFNKVLLLEQKGHSAMNSINARSPHHIIWRGMAHDASSKKMSQFALIWFRKLLLVREHLLSLQISIVETKDYSLSSTGMGALILETTLLYEYFHLRQPILQNRLERLKEHFHQEITTLSSLIWTQQWKPMSIKKISELLTLLIKKSGIEGFTAYSIKRASIFKLVAIEI
ncbi:MAG: hypothetical protein EZS28_013893 [Streblomastix strix]|uniref:Uncharacterized protein n=1 Tax=Streblomastix strix TaxID=222440 RepID=A0A5J4W6W3_9EUKA|nr:MAG: hypothetical protein EZS28_013893 [Streblomastix strix]